MGLADLTGNFTCITDGLLFDQGIDQINCIIKTGLFPSVDESRAKGNGDMGFAGSRAANKDQIVGVLRKLTGAELLDFGLFYC
jgi:hypothetical protein